jgi:hypothetical protein
MHKLKTKEKGGLQATSNIIERVAVNFTFQNNRKDPIPFQGIHYEFKLVSI